MEKIIAFFMNNIVEFLVIIVILGSLAGCVGWQNVVKPPGQISVLPAVDSLYEVLRPKIDSHPEAKEITLKILNEISSKIPLLSDGQITINDAFTEALIITPKDYKHFVIGLKLLFNTYYGDYGVAIPAEQRARIKTLTQIIDLLEGKLSE